MAVCPKCPSYNMFNGMRIFHGENEDDVIYFGCERCHNVFIEFAVETSPGIFIKALRHIPNKYYSFDPAKRTDFTEVVTGVYKPYLGEVTDLPV